MVDDDIKKAENERIDKAIERFVEETRKPYKGVFYGERFIQTAYNIGEAKKHFADWCVLKHKWKFPEDMMNELQLRGACYDAEAGTNSLIVTEYEDRYEITLAK